MRRSCSTTITSTRPSTTKDNGWSLRSARWPHWETEGRAPRATNPDSTMRFRSRTSCAATDAARCAYRPIPAARSATTTESFFFLHTDSAETDSTTKNPYNPHIDKTRPHTPKQPTTRPHVLHTSHQVTVRLSYPQTTHIY